MYTTLGKIGGLEPPEHWRKEEILIKQVIGPSIPLGTFTCVKSHKTVKAIWDMLKKTYKEKTRVLLANLMRHFRNTQCGENDNVHTHFKHLANLKEQLTHCHG